MSKIKRIQAIDNNFLPDLSRKFLNFYDVLDIVAKMFLIPRRQLDQSYSLSDYRWQQLKDHFKDYFAFYQTQMRQSVDKLPSIYKLDLQTAIASPRCYCLDLSKTKFTQYNKILWKCNSCKKYVAFLPKQVVEPMAAYNLL